VCRARLWIRRARPCDNGADGASETSGNCSFSGACIVPFSVAGRCHGVHRLTERPDDHMVGKTVAAEYRAQCHTPPTHARSVRGRKIARRRKSEEGWKNVKDHAATATSRRSSRRKARVNAEDGVTRSARVRDELQHGENCHFRFRLADWREKSRFLVWKAHFAVPLDRLGAHSCN